MLTRFFACLRFWGVDVFVGIAKIQLDLDISSPHLNYGPEKPTRYRKEAKKTRTTVVSASRSLNTVQYLPQRNARNCLYKTTHQHDIRPNRHHAESSVLRTLGVSDLLDFLTLASSTSSKVVISDGQHLVQAADGVGRLRHQTARSCVPFTNMRRGSAVEGRGVRTRQDSHPTTKNTHWCG